MREKSHARAVALAFALVLVTEPLRLEPVASGSAELAAATDVALVCPPDEARRRLRRMGQMGFDEVLLVSHYGEFEQLERARDLL